MIELSNSLMSARPAGGAASWHQELLVLEPIYQNAFALRGWQAAARQLARMTKTPVAFLLSEEDGTLFGRDAKSGPDHFTAAFQLAPESVDFFSVDMALAGVPEGGRAYVLKRRWRDGRSAGFVILEDREPGIEEAAMQKIAELAPHLRLSLGIALEMADEHDRGLSAALEMVGLPAMTLDRRGFIVAMNGAFRELRLPWSGTEAEAFQIADPHAQETLTRLLGGEFRGTQSILLRAGEDEASQHSLHFSLVPETMKAGLARAHLLVVGSPAGAAPVEMMRAMFSLSPGEAQLAREIALGHSIDEVSDSSDRSVHTVRNQLKAVLSKTGARNQTQLVSLLGRLIPLWDTGSDQFGDK